MRSLTSSVRVALVWLTALMVLVAGSPTVSCRCPDGRRKVFCFRSSDPSRPGCCTDSSCPAAPKAEGNCCQGCATRSHSRSESGARMETTGCSKELTPPGLVAVNDSHDADPLAMETGLFPVLSALDPLLVLPAALDGPLACPTPHSSPPSDRIVTLCHFII